ncbi:hypothetical protein [Sporolactobacillus vineae]|uniref:hypothetical protein n=1 Tax=Sporolactobacillus vineae TaxID=444463 RepID=UPI000287E4B4|nr:hypothetical protein [Sporolactobacillus vineae]
MRIKIFSDDNLGKLEKTVNDFLDQDDMVLIKDIQFSTYVKDADEMVPGNDQRLYYSVMIVHVTGKG